MLFENSIKNLFHYVRVSVRKYQVVMNSTVEENRCRWFRKPILQNFTSRQFLTTMQLIHRNQFLKTLGTSRQFLITKKFLLVILLHFMYCTSNEAINSKNQLAHDHFRF
jgi:hypothetical protein